MTGLPLITLDEMQEAFFAYRETLNFYQFILEESIQTLSLGIFLAKGDKNTVAMNDMIKKNQSNIDQLKWFADSNWAIPCYPVSEAFGRFAEASDRAMDYYRSQIAIQADIEATSLDILATGDIGEQMAITGTLKNVGTKDVSDDIPYLFWIPDFDYTIEKGTISGGLGSGQEKTVGAIWTPQKGHEGTHVVEFVNKYEDENKYNDVASENVEIKEVVG